MEGQEGVPIEVSGETARVEERSLFDPGTVLVGKDFEL